MSGLTCGVCGAPWKLDVPLLYHFGRLHCSTFACSRECEECKDDFEAIEAASPTNKSGTVSAGEVAPVAANFTKAPGYAEIMKKLKGGT